MNGPQGQLGVERMGEQLGPLAGWFKGGLISDDIIISIKQIKVALYQSSNYFDSILQKMCYITILHIFPLGENTYSRY